MILEILLTSIKRVYKTLLFQKDSSLLLAVMASTSHQKKEKVLLEHVYQKLSIKHLEKLQKYEENKTKIIFFNKYDKKVCLAVGYPSTANKGYCTRMVLKIDPDDLIPVADAFEKVKKKRNNVYIKISETERRNKPVQLVLYTDENNKLILTHFVGEEDFNERTINEVADGCEKPVDDDDDDDDMTVSIQWVAEWDKFYIAGEDNLSKFAQHFRKFDQKLRQDKQLQAYFQSQQKNTEEVKDENDDDDDDIIPETPPSSPPPPSPPPTQNNKRKYDNNDDDTEDKDRKAALGIWYTYHEKSGGTPKQTIVLYNNEMLHDLKTLHSVNSFNYFKLYKEMGEKCVNETFKKIEILKSKRQKCQKK